MMKVWQPTNEEIEKTKGWGTWSKEESEFPWHYDDTETCYILEGEASATDNKGNSIHFKAGDMVQFNEGLSCTWKINKAIRKRYQFG
jgi:uncharacterized cupin superfamily protein